MNKWKKNLAYFLTGQTISLFGSMIVQYAITWHITLETKSGLMMTIAIICGFLPTLFLSPFAGVWADKFNRKAIIIISDSLIALSTLILAILFLFGFDKIWLLFVIMTIRALGSAVQTPAVSSYIPLLVPNDKLTKVNAINQTIQSIMILISPILSALLLSITTLGYIFFIDVITAIIAIVILYFFMYVPETKTQENIKTDYFKDLKEGLIYISKNKYVLIFCIFSALFMFLAAPVSFLTPLQVTRDFGSEVWRLTVIEIAFSVGMMLGGIIIGKWGGFKNRLHTMVFSNVIIFLAIFGLGVLENFWIYSVVMGLIGIAMPIFNVPSTVILQQNIDKNFLGRVFGVFGMITSVSMPLGMLLFGPLSDKVKIDYILIATAIGMMIITVLMFKNKELVRVGAIRPQEEKN
ncbi:MAG TPA: MFS transporter [Acholeplasmataceae bacterium]|nr:MFS transporter [Acholeplasmataceae bacterium]